MEYCYKLEMALPWAGGRATSAEDAPVEGGSCPGAVLRYRTLLQMSGIFSVKTGSKTVNPLGDLWGVRIAREFPALRTEARAEKTSDCGGCTGWSTLGVHVQLTPGADIRRNPRPRQPHGRAWPEQVGPLPAQMP